MESDPISLSEHLRVAGTHALYAYEAIAGVRLDAETRATRDATGPRGKRRRDVPQADAVQELPGKYLPHL